METLLKQIQENIEELKIRTDLNHETIRNQGFKPTIEQVKELSRIAGQIDTFTSCYQMIDNQMSLNN